MLRRIDPDGSEWAWGDDPADPREQDVVEARSLRGAGSGLRRGPAPAVPGALPARREAAPDLRRAGADVERRELQGRRRAIAPGAGQRQRPRRRAQGSAARRIHEQGDRSAAGDRRVDRPDPAAAAADRRCREGATGPRVPVPARRLRAVPGHVPARPVDRPGPARRVRATPRRPRCTTRSTTSVRIRRPRRPGARP